MSTIRWGVLGTGWMASTMADALAVVPDAELIAVGSRTNEAAERFGRAHGVPKRFAQYEDLVACPDVDIVYVATPHASHAGDAALALNAGKPVLCEKPLTVNAREASHLIDLAHSRSLLLMEAMWTRYVPAVVTLREWMAAGTIGAIRHVSATLGWAREVDPAHRLFDPTRAGGALLDLGVYPVSFFSMLLGTPTDIAGVMTPAPTGVDLQCAGTLTYANGAVATFAVSLAADLPNEVRIVGTDGWIRVHAPMVAPESLSRGVGREVMETVHRPLLGNGYPHEVLAVNDCLRAANLESDLMPLDESLQVMQTLDALRAPWTLKYTADLE